MNEVKEVFEYMIVITTSTVIAASGTVLVGAWLLGMYRMIHTPSIKGWLKKPTATIDGLNHKTVAQNLAEDREISKKAAKEVIKLAKLAKKAKKYAKSHPIA